MQVTKNKILIISTKIILILTFVLYFPMKADAQTCSATWKCGQPEYSGFNCVGCNNAVNFDNGSCSGRGLNSQNACQNFAPQCACPVHCVPQNFSGCNWNPGAVPTNTPVPSCSCGNWTPITGCGGDSGAGIGCAANERYYTRTCTPNGCASQGQCFQAGECGGVAPTNTPAPSDSAPIGFHDSPSDAACQLYGWTCDPNSWGTKLNVHFYEGGTFLGSYVAQDANEAAVTAACGGNPGHRFNFSLPTALRNGLPHSITAYALGVNSAGVENGANPSLGGNPKTITCSCPIPSAPTLSVPTTACDVPGSTADIQLSWTSVFGISGYNVYRGGALIATKAAGVTTHTDPGAGLTCGTNYVYTVRAVSSCGSLSSPSNTANRTAACTPNSPTAVTASDGTYNSVNVTWSDNSSTETEYRVYRNLTGTGAVAYSLAANSTSVSDSAAVCSGAQLPYSVRAVRNVAGIECVSNSASDNGWCQTYPNWSQTSAGNVTVNGTVTQQMPVAQPFASGVLTYRTSATFTPSGTQPTRVDASVAEMISTNTFAALSGRIKSKVTLTSAGAGTINQAQVNSGGGGVAYGDGRYFEFNSLNVGSTGTVAVPDGQKIVVVVNGDVTISNNITLGVGSNFVIVASGNITIADSVGTAGTDPKTLTSAQSHVQGIYFSGGTFNTGTGYDGSGSLPSDYRNLRLEGSFVGRTGVGLSRYSTNLYPGEYIVFRPELVLGIPTALNNEGRLFEEVAP